VLGLSFWVGLPICKAATVSKQRDVVRTLKRETVPLLQSPANEYLRIVFPMFARDGGDGWMIEHPLPGLDEWTVRLNYDAILAAIIHDLSLLTEWMKLAQKKRIEMS